MRNTKSQEYHDKNIELCRIIMNEYATTNQTWETTYKAYDITSSLFYKWISKYGLTDELNAAKKKAKSSHITKVQRATDKDLIRSIKQICDYYAKEPVTWEEACNKYGLTYSNFREKTHRYRDVIGHMVDAASLDHKRNKIRRIQEQADHAVEVAVDALVQKLQKRTVKEVQEKQVIDSSKPNSKISKKTTVKKVKEIEPDMEAIKTVLKLTGLLNESQQIIIQNDINVLGTTDPKELEKDQFTQFEELQDLGISDEEMNKLFSDD